VVVTATKREESLQNVPISVTVLTGQALEQAGMTDFKEYAVHVPNLSFGYTDYFGPTAQSIAIRGVQGPNTTGMYIDDTPLPENLDARAIDLARIEVLRGPQGTLYGADSMGGAVRLITRQPDPSAIGGGVHDVLSYTDGGGVNDLFDGTLNVPLTRSAAIRIVGYIDSVSGVLNKRPLPEAPVQFPEQRGVDTSQHRGGSITGLFKLGNDSVTLTPRFILGQTHADGLPYADTSPANFSQYRLFLIREPIDDDWNLGSFTARWNTPVGDVTSATSYFSRYASDLQDFSEAADLYLGAAEPTSATQLDILHQTSTSEELRFTSAFSGPFQVTAGFFYEYAIKRLDTPPIVFGATPNIFAQALRDATSEYALFGEASYAITPRLKVIAGARAYRNGDDFSTTNSGTLAYNGTLAGKQNANGTSPKYSVEYAFTDQIKAYATAAKGFRLGGVNAFPPDLCAQDLADLHLTLQQAQQFNSDSLWSYELGVKSTLADHRVVLNAAAYHIDWSNLQQNLQFPTCGYTLTVNSGRARSNGGEVELDALITSGLNFTFGAGYEDAVITESSSPIPAGTPVQQVPRWNVTSAAQYDATIWHQDLFARMDFAYVGSSISTNNSVSPPYERGAYSLLNLRIGRHFGTLDVAALCDNIANRIGNLGDVQPLALPYPGRPQLAVTRPRTAGLDFRYTF
jgi:outer membrane receptor protein involved in Fe transport